MASTMPLSVRLLSLFLLLSACTEPDSGYGFDIEKVELSPGYQHIAAIYRQSLSLSRDARDALEHGVPLVVRVQMELRDSMTLTLLSDDIQRYEIRFLPMSEHYELVNLADNSSLSFPRLRHVMNNLSRLSVDLSTGPLVPGKYEFRARTSIENARLPAPMHLPALFSSQWQHDSEWSTWPFEISA